MLMWCFKFIALDGELVARDTGDTGDTGGGVQGKTGGGLQWDKEGESGKYHIKLCCA